MGGLDCRWLVPVGFRRDCFELMLGQIFFFRQLGAERFIIRMFDLDTATVSTRQ